MMKSLLAILLLLALPFCAAAEEFPSPYWPPDPTHIIVCVGNRAGCQVLQMVMTGSFDGYDPEDPLSGRILSAALPKLCAITDADIAHFLEYFAVSEGTLRRCWYIAMANCLWADIDLGLDPGGSASAARRVLQLFLDPASETDAEAQMHAIRSQTDDDAIHLLAQSAGVPESLVRYLIFADNWCDFTAPIIVP